MKSARIQIVIALLGFLFAWPAGAATLTWDSNGATAPLGQDGTGTWDTTTANWSNGATNVTWNNATPDSAVFGNAGTAGTVTLGEPITAGGLTFNSGVTGNYTIAGNTLTLAGGASVTTNASVTISSALAGADFTKNGTTTLTLSGANTFTGVLTATAGTVSISNASALGTLAGNTVIQGSNGSTATTLAISGGLTFAENLSLNGTAAGRATLSNVSGTNTWSGNIDVSSTNNLAQITVSSGSLAITGDISGTFSGGALLFVRGGGSGGTITGNINLNGGTFAKTDDNTWTVGAAGKTYAWGATTVARGTLKAGVANVLPSATLLTIGQNDNANATFDLNGFSQTVGGLVHIPGTGGTKSITNSGAAATFTVDNAGNYSFGGPITGNLALVKQGAGTLTLGGTSTFNGDTRIAAGTLTLANSSALGGSTLDYNSYGGSLSFGTLTSATFGGLKGAQDLALTNAGSANVALTVGGNNQSTTYSGALSGGGSLTKTGTGTLDLSGLNTFSGKLAVQNGVLQFSSVENVGSASPNALGLPITVANGAFDLGATTNTGTLKYVGSAAASTDRVVNLAGAAGGACLDSSGTGTITFTSDLTATVAGAKTLTLGGTSTGANTIQGRIVDSSGGATSLAKIGAGTWVLGGANTYTGATTIQAGKLALSGGDNRLSTATTIAFTGPGTLDVDSNSQTVAGLTAMYGSTGTSTITGAAGTLAVSGTNNFTVGGTATNAVVTLDLSGLGTFSYANSAAGGKFDAGTQFAGNAGGVVLLADDNTITASRMTTSDSYVGTSVALAAQSRIALGTTNVINADSLGLGQAGRSNSLLDFRAGLTNPTLTLRGWDGTSRVANVNVAKGGAGAGGQMVSTVDLTAGTVDAQIQNLLITSQQPASNNNNTNTGTFKMGAGTLDAVNITLGQYIGTGTGSTASATFSLDLGGALVANTLTLGDYQATTANTLNSTFNLTNGTFKAATIKPGLSNGGTVTRTFNWTSGTIQNYDASTDLAIASGLTLTMNPSGTHAFNIDTGRTGTIDAVLAQSGAGAGLDKQGPGLLLLNAVNTFTGDTKVSGGILRLGDAAALGLSTLDYNNYGGTLSFNNLTAVSLGGLKGAQALALANDSAAAVDLTVGANNASTTYSGVLSGDGTLTKVGTGTLTLSGANAHTGLTAVRNGAILVANNSALGTTAAGIELGALSGTGTIESYLDLGNGVTLTGEPVTMLSSNAGGVNFRSALRANAGATATYNGDITTSGNHINMFVANGTMTLQGTISGTSGGWQLRGTGTGTLESVVTLGATALNKTDGGTWTVKSTGNVWGATNASQGTLKLGANDALPVTTALTVGQGDTATATVDLNGYNQTVAALTNNGLTGQRIVTNTGAASTLTVNNSADSTYAGTIMNGANALNLVKDGTGTLTLSGANTYTGTTTITNGTLLLGAVSPVEPAVASTALYWLDANDPSTIVGTTTVGTWKDKTANARDFSQATAANQPAYVLNGSGQYVLSFDGSNDQLTYLGATVPETVFIVARPTANAGGLRGIWGSSNPSDKGIRYPNTAGTVWQSPGDGNDFTNGTGGAMYINGVATNNFLTTGAMHVLTAYNGTSNNNWANNTNLGWYYGGRVYQGEIAEVLAFGTALNATDRAAIQNYLYAKWVSNPIPDNSPVSIAATGKLDLNSRTEGIGNLSGADGAEVILGTGQLIVNQAGNTTYSGAITGAGSVVKNDAGTLTLDGASTYGGGTTVAGGFLAINSNGAVGGGDITFVSGGKRIILGNGVNLANNVVINGGTPDAGNGLIQGPASGSATLSGDITFNAIPANGGMLNGVAGLVLTGFASGTVPFSQRAGTVTYAGSGSYSELLLTGTGKLGITNGIATNAVVNVGISGNGSLDLLGYNQTLAGLQRTNTGTTATVTNSNATTLSTLTINNSANYAYSGTLTGNLAVVKQGPGTQTLAGNNTYTGTTTVDGGTLELRSLGTAAYTYTGGTISINNGSTLRISTGGSGGGTQYWFNGKTFVFGSDGGGTIDTTSGLNFVVYGGSVFRTTGGAADTIIGASGINLHNSNIATFDVARGSDATSDLTVSAPFWNAGGITKSGNGILTLSGANTYTGATTIQKFGGVLRIQSPNALGGVSGGTTIQGNVDANSRLELAGDITFDPEPLSFEARQGAGQAPAFVNVSGDNTWTGPITLNTGGGDYRIESQSGTMTISGNISQGNSGARRLYLQGSGDGVLSGRYLSVGSSDTGTVLIKEGSGTWTLSGDNTYKGNTTVSVGTLLINGSIAGAAIANGGLLGGNGAIAGNVTINAAGSISAGNGPGHLTIGGTYAQNDGRLLAELGGANQGVDYDWIDVAQTATLDPGSLIDVDLVNGFLPGEGSRFDILTAANGITNVDLSGILFDFSGAGIGTETWQARIVSLGGSAEAIRLEVVPEPVTLLALGLGLGTLGGYIRRRRR